MTDQHPIAPPPELVRQWVEEAATAPVTEQLTTPRYIATQAARWGADQELEACRLWVSENCDIYSAVELIQFRRPKPPSLKEQALQELDLLTADATTHGLGFDASAIRRALESLPE